MSPINDLNYEYCKGPKVNSDTLVCNDPQDTISSRASGPGKQIMTVKINDPNVTPQSPDVSIAVVAGPCAKILLTTQTCAFV